MAFFEGTGTGSFEDFCRDLFPMAFPQSDVGEFLHFWKKEDDKFIYTLEVPGYNKGNMDISVENDKLIVKFGDKAKSVRIPQSVDIDKISATCENGLLRVDLPVLEGAKPRKIEIS